MDLAAHRLQGAIMSDTTVVFVPTKAELELLTRLDAGEPTPFPEHIKRDFSDRLYEHGFVAVGVDGGLTITERGEDLLTHHMLLSSGV
jgi:kynurenine formamidase